MPPPKAKRGQLTTREISLLRRWIEQGAPYQGHWAFEPVANVAIPDSWQENPIDYFVEKRLKKAGVSPSAPTDPETLLRRLSLDLTGLLPSLEEQQSFPAAGLETTVDRLLASPHFGERWGRHWLDQARYADSHGYSIDGDRQMWPFRDWVIKALNDDLPFDQFTIEQLAGDLLPAGTDAQAYADRLTATGFLTLAPKGLGMQDKELMALDVVDDQLDVLGRAMMGITISCARCHDHKFDPISTRDYYALAGIFRSTETVNALKSYPSYWPESPLELPSVTAARKKYLSRKTANTKAAAAVRVKAKAALAKQARGQLAEYLFTAAQVHHKIIEITKIKKGLVPGLVKNLAAHIAKAKANPKSPLHPFTKAAPAGVEKVTKLVNLEDESFQKLLGDEKKGPLVPGDDAAAFFADPFKMQLAKLSAEAKDLLVDKGWDPTMGARPLRRAIQRYIEDPLADEVLKAGDLPSGTTVMVERDESGDEDDQPLKLRMIKPRKKKAKKKDEEEQKEPVGVGAETPSEGDGTSDMPPDPEKSD